MSRVNVYTIESLPFYFSIVYVYMQPFNIQNTYARKMKY